MHVDVTGAEVTVVVAGAVAVGEVVDVTGAAGAAGADVEVVVPATGAPPTGGVEVGVPATPVSTGAGSAGAVVTGADAEVVVPATGVGCATTVLTATASLSWIARAAETCSSGRDVSPGWGSVTIGAVGAVKICGTDGAMGGSWAGST